MYRIFIRRNYDKHYNLENPDCTCDCCRLQCHLRCECCKNICFHGDDQTCVCACDKFIICTHECRLSRPSIYIDFDIPDSRIDMIRYENELRDGSCTGFFTEYVVATVSYDTFRVAMVSYEKCHKVSDGMILLFVIQDYELADKMSTLVENGDTLMLETVEILNIVKM